MHTQLATCLFLALISTAHAHRPAKPNVVLILADDLDWQDVKCYDIDEPSPFETPNVDPGMAFKADESTRPVALCVSYDSPSCGHPAWVTVVETRSRLGWSVRHFCALSGSCSQDAIQSWYHEFYETQS